MRPRTSGMLDGKDEVMKSMRFCRFLCRFRRAGAQAALAVLLLVGVAPGSALAASADPKLTVWGGGVDEGDSGTQDLSFTVRLAPASEERVTVDVNTGPYPADITAISDYSRIGGPDYEAVTDRTLTFEPGETEKTVNVRVIGDRLYEYDSERFKLHLSNAVNAEIEIGSAIGWIFDDDGMPTLTIKNQTVSESDSGTKIMTFTATLSNPTENEVFFSPDIVGITATEGEDYLVPKWAYQSLEFWQPGTPPLYSGYFFPPGPFDRPQQQIISGKRNQIHKVFHVVIMGDEEVEEDETFRVTVRNVQNAVLVSSRITGTIKDDDRPVAPTASNGRVKTYQDTPHAFKADDFGFADENEGDALASVTIATLPTAGSLVLVDVPVTAKQAVSKADLDAGNLSFRPATNARGDGHATFTFRVSDGSLVSVDSYTMTIDVTAPDAAPTGKPVVSGTTSVGYTLTALTSRIADGNGLGSPGWEYRWKHSGTASGTEPADIADQTTSTYELVVADQGKWISVAVTFSDDDGNRHTLASDWTGPVGAGLPPLPLSLDTIADDDTINSAERAAGFSITGDTGTESGASVKVTVGSETLSATSDTDGGWSVSVPAAADYITGNSVDVTVGARKPGFSAPESVRRTLKVSQVAPKPVYYTAPATLKVGVTIADMSPSWGPTEPDLTHTVDEFRAAGLPSGLRIDASTGFISGTPDRADANAAATRVTVSDAVGNTVTISITFPAVAKGDQTLTGFRYSAASVALGSATPTVTAPSGVQTSLSYSATPSDVCTVSAATGALTLLGVGECAVTATAAGTADYNEASAVFTVTVGPPAAPADLQAQPGDGEVTLTWAAPERSETITGYEYRFCPVESLTQCPYEPWRPGDGTDTQFTVRYWHKEQNGETIRFRLINGIKYRFQVRAVAGEIKGAATSEVEATPVATAARPTLVPPTNLTASGLTHEAVTLSWVPPDGLDVTAYQVLIRFTDRDPVGQFAVLVQDTGSTDTTYKVTGLAAGTRHVFRVKAHTADGRLTPRSRWVDVDTPPTPDDTRDSAVTLDAQAAAQRTRYYRDKSLDRTNGDAVDYYTFTLTQAKELGLGVRGQSIELTVTLEDANGVTVGTAGPPKNPGLDQVYIEWLKQVIEPGTYYVRVEAAEDGSTGYYLRFGLKDPPPAVSVADARAEEGPGATLDFAVTLDRAPTGEVTVDYATADGTATAGDDYTAVSDTLTFAAGETSKTISVTVLDDSLDEGAETMTLTLSSPSGLTIADGEATGTITNSDPIPEAWLARFGRTVTGQVLDAVEARLAAPRTAGADVEPRRAGAAVVARRMARAAAGGDTGIGNTAAERNARRQRSARRWRR